MEFITDRTEYDALVGNYKGVYSYTDLNRVETAVKLISDTMSLGLTTKTNWSLPAAFNAREWPVESQMKRYLANVAAVRRHFGITYPIPSTMDRLTWQGANNIELILKKAMASVDGVIEAYRYSGEFYAGEE